MYNKIRTPIMIDVDEAGSVCRWIGRGRFGARGLYLSL